MDPEQARSIRESVAYGSSVASAPEPAVPACTGDPARVTTDPSGRIVEWSLSAAELLGYPASTVRGRRIHEALQSRDFFGNRIACECGVREMLRRGEHVWRQVISVTTATGDTVRVVLLVKAASQSSTNPRLLYEIRLDARRHLGDRRAPDRSRRFPAGIGILTPAELKVLRLLASGKRAQHVAGHLNVSVTTVRHHIQNVLKKLDVHTQVEAISMVLQSGVL